MPSTKLLIILYYLYFQLLCQKIHPPFSLLKSQGYGKVSYSNMLKCLTFFEKKSE